MPEALTLDTGAMRKMWQLLTNREKRHAILLLVLASVTAISTTLMVASIMPFLSLLSDPSRLQSTPALLWLYQRLGFSSSYQFLMALGVLAIGIICVGVAMQVLKSYAVTRYSMMRIHSFSSRLMISYLSQPYEYFLQHHSGDMGTRILAEAQECVFRFLRPFVDFTTSLITVLCLTLFLIWVNPWVAILSFVIFASIYGITYWITSFKLEQWGNERVRANSERYRLATEAIGGVKEIKLLGREALYLERFQHASFQTANMQTKGSLMAQVPYFAIQGIAFVAVMLLCMLMVDADPFNQKEALGAIVPLLGTFAFAGQRMMPELGILYQSIVQMQSGKAAVEAIYDDIMANTNAALLAPPERMNLRESLRLESVSYRYPNSTSNGIADISLTVKAGEKIGIVGTTGAGKSTLADIILGLLPPYAGQLIVDSLPLTDANLRAWQQTLGYVPQDIFLIDASITENIALGVPPESIDKDRVIRAATIANIASFIEKELPSGYDTEVGERGVRLSGGQRQRIGIARALYHDADLIVFDEATSALDNTTEADVIAAIDALPQGKTILIIAHRLSTVKRCDKIIVMEKGSVVACDGWDKLLETSEAFQRIVTAGGVTH